MSYFIASRHHYGLLELKLYSPKGGVIVCLSRMPKKRRWTAIIKIAGLTFGAAIGGYLATMIFALLLTTAVIFWVGEGQRGLPVPSEDMQFALVAARRGKGRGRGGHRVGDGYRIPTSGNIFINRPGALTSVLGRCCC